MGFPSPNHAVQALWCYDSFVSFSETFPGADLLGRTSLQTDAVIEAAMPPK